MIAIYASCGSTRLAAINGQPVEAHLGRTLAEVIPDLASALEPLFQRILDTGTSMMNLEIRRRVAVWLWTAPYLAGELLSCAYQGWAVAGRWRNDIRYHRA